MFDNITNSIEIPASELDTNDIFPSHDGLAHDVVGVVYEEGDAVVRVNVRKSNGDTYSVEFAPDHRLRVAVA